MNLVEKGKTLLGDVRTHWRIPAKGNYMNYREIAAYSVGGLGAYFIFTMAQQLLLSTTNVIIGNTIGIQPLDMYVMYLISVVTNIPLTALRANMIDNVRHKEGKYRPYILRMGIPTVIISMVYVYTPYDKMGYLWRCVLIFIYNFLLQFFYNFFYDSYENLIHVLSPNTQERTNVTAIKSVLYSFSPTLTNFLIPIIAGRVADGNMYDLAVYRWLYPFIAVFGIGLSIVVYANTEEKIVQAKTHEIKVRFIDALREVAKNKYFWIISLAGWIGFLEGATSSILQWLYNYGKLCSPEQYSFITLIHGNASLWGMLLCPFAVKKWGKKAVLIVTNLFNIVFLACLYPAMHSIWVVLIFTYLNSLMGSFAVILNPTIQADIRDYQQYVSGERIDGMFAAVGLIGSFITMATSSVLPACYEKYGIFAGNGYENMYDILFDTTVLYKLIGVLVILSVVGATLNVIPFFFYDLSELKQKKIIRILKIRAIFEDYGNGALTGERLEEETAFVHSCRKNALMSTADTAALKHNYKSIKDREARKLAKTEYKNALENNTEIELSKAAVEEMSKFSSPLQQKRVQNAREFVASGVNGVFSVDDNELKLAKAMPRLTKEEKEIRGLFIDDARKKLRCRALAKKNYPDGIKEFDTAVFDELYKEEHELDEKQVRLNKELGAAKKSGDRNACTELRKQIKISNDERYVISGRIKAAQKESAVYHACVKAYKDAEKLVLQCENYAKL